MTHRKRKAPEVVPEAGWIPVPNFPGDDVTRPFLTGDTERVRVAFFRKEDSELVYGRAWFGPGAQGPPGSAHGGSMASVLDEAMGAWCWIHGHRVVAARLTAHFRKRRPLGTDARVEAWIDKIDGRKLYAKSRLFGEDGQNFAEGEGLFIELTAEQFADIVEKADRATWAGPGA